MKRNYQSPDVQLILLEKEAVLAASGGNYLIDPGEDQSGDPAEDFGNVTLW